MSKILDGAYQNAAIGLGEIGIDKTAETRATPYSAADLIELARMQMQDGIADTIVTAPPSIAFSNDITIAGDDTGEIFEEAVNIGLLEAIQSAGEEQRLTGGAIIVAEYEGDESDLMELPNDTARITGYRVYSSGDVVLNTEDFEGDEPTKFRVKRKDGREIQIAPERVTVVKGRRLPGVLGAVSVREQYFGTSALKPVEKSLKDLATVTGSIVNMASETGTLLLSIDGINEMLSKPDNGVHELRDMISMVKLCMSSMRATFAGSNDKFSILSHNFGGLPEIMQKLMILVSAKSHIPMSVLFGQTATGLSQTGEGDLKSYAHMVNSWRQRYLYKPTAKLLADFAKRNFNKEVNGFIWGTIDTRSLTEELDARTKEAQIDEKAINLGILTPEEIRSARYVNGHSFELNVDK